MRIDNSIRSQVQSTQESATSSSAEEKTSAQTNTESQSNDSVENAAGSLNTFEAATAQAKQELSVARQLQMLGVDNPTKEQIDAGVKIANDPAAQKRLQQELSVAKQLAMLGVDNPTKEQIEAGVKIATNRQQQEDLQSLMGIMKQKEMVGVAEQGDNLGELLKGILETPGDTKWSPFDAVKDALKTPGDTPWSLSGVQDDLNALKNPPAARTHAPGGMPQPSSPSGSSGGTSTSGASNDTPTGSSGPIGGEGRLFPNDGSNTGTASGSSGSSSPSDDGAVSDPSEWESYPGSSEPSGSGEGTSTEKVHVYHSEDSGKTWEDKGVQWTEYPPTQVEVEAPDSGSGDTGGADAGGTKINEGEDDKYYAWGEGGSLSTGELPPEQRGEEITSGTTGASNTLENLFSSHPEGSAIKDRSYKEGFWTMDHAGGVTDGSRPDMEDSSTRESPYEGPGFGVIDTTPEVDDYTAWVGEPQVPKSGPTGDPTNPDNPVEDSRPGGGPPSTDPYSDNT